ncbi:MAG: hypothetical protein A3C50_00235 [Candidatus Staskawiczbacteria bacterium RIFCSPHIGHO2_02_FULL_43_16]|uniref:Cytochrome b561 domain-containing protein n=1 Tax=Candidatus Staskawiczbacteria bacterium RIFCSPHIGHO2_01_FULL_41_41 TaxID=1802203 RepID=A0A1G2HVB2_9BACT|nr:MAG: hypothetical protein A2822_01900 [Candidatus Staskawiczbacteria bacterium RIFCSPHIGHO2_01_FULL_41_41]OGZ68917.1 MAG: hypothetical protein A3C50_00235 [Candidatus Staskawiczbacteria bacterium RIFCSPHIGHO2_02_FULL_43_16]OGZ74901.1 MAG: hypothetical protein A3A12_03580 [Candidatus Staskawiczbacteria bacterium RIFCSPLOWO2_01_FULL_43_17b]
MPSRLTIHWFVAIILIIAFALVYSNPSVGQWIEEIFGQGSRNILAFAIVVITAILALAFNTNWRKQ